MPTQLNGKKHYTIEEVCHITKINKRVFLQWAKNGTLADTEGRITTGYRDRRNHCVISEHNLVSEHDLERLKDDVKKFKRMIYLTTGKLLQRL